MARKRQKNDGILRLDLHGQTTAAAVDELERAIDRAILGSIARLEVIHGIGSGAVKKAVHGYLARSRHVERYFVDPVNAGTTWVYL